MRVHHHLVVPAEAKEAFTEKWAGMGGVDWSPMSDQEDYTPIAAYLIRQVRRVPDAKSMRAAGTWCARSRKTAWP
mgnify:CR=1 FL=1